MPLRKAIRKLRSLRRAKIEGVEEGDVDGEGEGEIASRGGEASEDMGQGELGMRGGTHDKWTRGKRRKGVYDNDHMKKS